MEEPIIVTRKESTAEIALNRPDAFNALTLDMIILLSRQLTSLAGDAAVKGIIIHGNGKAFCAGGDLKWVHGHPDGPSAAFHALAGQFHVAVTEIRRMRKPVIAAMNGVAAGGGFSLALSCDFRVMEKDAFMKQAYTSSGLSIDGGGTFTLPRLVGLARALEIAAFDEPIPAEQAFEWGLVTRLAEPGRALEEATRMMDALKKRSIHSFHCSKNLLNDSHSTPFETQIEKERMALFECGNHPDGREGLAAFVEKRKPKYNE